MTENEDRGTRGSMNRDARYSSIDPFETTFATMRVASKGSRNHIAILKLSLIGQRFK
jgi:hypothetical protein